MGKNYFDRFDTIPAMQLSPPPGVTEVAPLDGQGPISLSAIGALQGNAGPAPGRKAGGSAGAPTLAPTSGGNYFDRFDLQSGPPTLPTPPSLPDWMTNPAPADWGDVMQLLGMGGATPPAANGTAAVGMGANTGPTIYSGEGGIDPFGVSPGHIPPAATPPQSLPRATNLPATVPPPIPTPQPYVGPAVQRGPAKWRVDRAQAMANPPVPSALPAPAASTAPTPTITWDPNGMAYQIQGDRVIFDPNRFGIGVDQAKRHAVLGYADYYALKTEQAQIEQALQERRKLEAEAGQNPALKAALAGMGKGAVELGGFVAGASAAQPAVGSIAAATGPYSIVVEPVGTGIAGALGAYGAGALYDKALQEIAVHTGHFRDILAARQLMPGYDRAGQLLFVAAGTPLSAARLAQGFRMIQVARGTPEAARFLARTAGLGGASSAISGAFVDAVAHRIDPKHNPGTSVSGMAQNFLLGSLAGPPKWSRPLEIPDQIVEGSSIRELRASARGYAKGKAMLSARYQNRATGRNLLIDGDTFSHIFSNLGSIHVHLVPWLPDIIRDAIPLTLSERHEPRIAEIPQIQRLALPVTFRGRTYLVTLTAKDHVGAKGLHLYDVKAVPVGGVGSVGKVLPPGATQGPRRNGPTTDPTPSR